MKQLGVFLLPLNGMLVHRRSLPRNLSGFSNNSAVPIYTSGWREALWESSVLPRNTTQCPRPGLEPGPLALGVERTKLEATAPPQYKLTRKCQKVSWVMVVYGCLIEGNNNHVYSSFPFLAPSLLITRLLARRVSRHPMDCHLLKKIVLLFYRLP